MPGNHDLLFDTHPDIIDALIPQGITYIEEGEITLDGVRFYVLPARPYLHDGKLLPRDIDVLVTHGAPKGALDEDGVWGCPLLRETIEQSEPKVHIFGHAHKCGGQRVAIGNTMCYNVAEYDRLFA